MATMNISLPDPMKEWVENQTSTGRFSNTSDVVRDLVRREQERQAAIAELQALIKEGDDSGLTDATLEDIRAEVKQELTQSSDAV